MKMGTRVVCIAPCIGSVANDTAHRVIETGQTGVVGCVCDLFEGRVMVSWSSPGPSRPGVSWSFRRPRGSGRGRSSP